MAIHRNNPWHPGQLQNEINRLFTGAADPESSAATASWVPSVDINEFNDRFQLYVDLPGVDPTAVEITLDNGLLSVSGERNAPNSTEDKAPANSRTERAQGPFHRRFTLPDTVDADNVKATNRNGVLEISIPKQAKVQPRKIEVMT